MIYTTGHTIADTVAKYLPDGDYGIAYGILRGTPENLRKHNHWFVIDRGFTSPNHFDGNYRLGYKNTQPMYFEVPNEPCNLDPWREGEYTLVCPPTPEVCKFFGIDQTEWILKNLKGKYILRHKGDPNPIEWDKIGKLVTFNSSLGVEALKRGIAVESDPLSTLGSYKNLIYNCDRSPIMSFIRFCQFKLTDKGKINCLINHYLSTSDGIHAKK